MQTGSPVFPNHLTQPITDHQAILLPIGPYKMALGAGGQTHQARRPRLALPPGMNSVAKLPSILYTSCPGCADRHPVPARHGSHSVAGLAEGSVPSHCTPAVVVDEIEPRGR